MFLVKVGKKEHLEEFSNGYIYFNPISYFKEDSTLFRGDKNEGLYYMDTSGGVKLDDIELLDIFERVEVTTSFTNVDNVLLFCASILNNNNFYLNDNNQMLIKGAFYQEMRKFGQYAVIFDMEIFIKNLNSALKNIKCNMHWGQVNYCDKTKYDDVMTCLSNSKKSEDVAIFFLKDKAGYEQQNEWRYAIEYNSPNIVLNENNGFKIKIDSFPTRLLNLDALDKFIST